MAKPRNVEEAAGTYSTSPKKGTKASTPAPAQPEIRYAKSEEVRTANARLMQVHRKVLQKLAQ